MPASDAHASTELGRVPYTPLRLSRRKRIYCDPEKRAYTYCEFAHNPTFTVLSRHLWMHDDCLQVMSNGAWAKLKCRVMWRTFSDAPGQHNEVVDDVEEAAAKHSLLIIRGWALLLMRRFFFKHAMSLLRCLISKSIELLYHFAILKTESGLVPSPPRLLNQ